MIERDRSLRELNTFGFAQRAERYAEAGDEATLIELLERAADNGWPVLVLGGGSNVVLTRDVPGLVIRMTERRIERERATGSAAGAARVTATAGVDWHDLVLETLAEGLDGLENLSLIPGSVGAAPVQNIGAYGVELHERLHSVRAWHRPSRSFRTLDVDACAFGYRDSLFKRRRGEYVITRVSFELGPHRPRVSGYTTLAARLAELGLENPSALDVSRAVIDVRRARLPDPAEVGNAGSFFHNPVVSAERAAALAAAFPGIVLHAQPDGRVKVAAGWLIDRLGLRGHRENGVGVHHRQALVLIREEGGTGAALLSLATRIVREVEARYGLVLTPEPLIV